MSISQSEIIGCPQLLKHDAMGKERADTRATRFSHRRGSGRVAQESHDSVRKGNRVARRNEQSGLAAPHDFRKTSRGCRNNRPFHGHRLKDGNPEPFHESWMHIDG
jgi:hypothetical protein